jgi:aspartate/methionine/tyrosine aminotransferase
VDLTSSNPTRVGIADDDSWVELLARAQCTVYEPAPFGIAAARAAVAEHLTNTGLAVDPEQVVLCASTSEAYSFLFKLLTDPGDSILFPRPSYPLLEHLAAFEQLRLAHYSIDYDGSYFIDRESTRRASCARCKALVLVSPNNPTGSCTTVEEFQAVSGLGIPLISDEVFADYPLQADSGPIPSVLCAQSGLVFSRGGLSKAAGLPQLKLAWIVVGGPLPIRSEALARLELICDTFLSVNTPVQVALPELLKRGAGRRVCIQQRLKANLDLLTRRVRGTPVSLRAPQGGWSVVLQLPKLGVDDWALHLLTQAHVLVQPGWFYDDPHEGVIVLSLLTCESDFAEGLDRLLIAVAQLDRPG